MEAEFCVGASIPRRGRRTPVAPLVRAPDAPAPSASSSTPFAFERPRARSLDQVAPPSSPLPPPSSPPVLPSRAWAVLSSVLSTRDLARVAQTCRAWRVALAAGARTVTLTADGAKIRHLRVIVPAVEVLIFADAATLMNCGEGDLYSLMNLLEMSVVAPPQVFPSKLASAHDASMIEFCLIGPHLPMTLTHLSLPLCRFSRGSLAPLERLTNLTHLDLSRGDWRADDWNWTPLCDNPAIDDWIDHFPLSLVSLNLSHCHILSDRMLKKIRRLPKLQTLKVENCFQLTDAGMASLPATVEILDMAQCIGVFRKGDARLGVLPPKLSWLRLSFNFNDHFVGYIPNTLTVLLLEKSFVTDNGMRVLLAQLKNLVELSCAACINVTDATLALLPSSLKTLDLWHNRNVTDEGLKVMNSRAPLLEVLDLTCCPKVSLSGITAALQSPPFRLIAVGTLFVPERFIDGVAVIRDKVGIYHARPKLFSEMSPPTAAQQAAAAALSPSAFSNMSFSGTSPGAGMRSSARPVLADQETAK